LHPDDGVFIDFQQRVRIALPQGATAADHNVAANGMLDFILSYYNPPANGFDGGSLALKERRYRLPLFLGRPYSVEWDRHPRFTPLTFDGRFAPAGVERRIIGLDGEAINLTNPNRKGECGLRGKPNANFIGSITVDMANLLRRPTGQGGLAVAEFRNTNIIGDGDRWEGIEHIGGADRLIITGTNLGLIGDYTAIDNFNRIGGGVTDILGIAPPLIQSDLQGNYINLWNNVSRQTQISGLSTVFLRQTGGEHIITGMVGTPQLMANMIIHSQKHDSLNLTHPALIPSHRAFVDNAGQVRITGPDLTGIDPIHLGSNHPAFPAIPSPHEEDWINAANGDPITTPGVTLVNGMPQLAPNYAALRGIDGGRYVWADLYHFQTQAARGGE